MSRWTVYDPERLARTIRAYCGIAQWMAEKLVQELEESGSGVTEFRVRSEVEGFRSSHAVTCWQLLRSTGPYRKSYALQRLDPEDAMARKKGE